MKTEYCTNCANKMTKTEGTYAVPYSKNFGLNYSGYTCNKCFHSNVWPIYMEKLTITND